MQESSLQSNAGTTWINPSDRLILPLSWSALNFARDEASGHEERPAEPARILIVEDDFLIATQVEAALADAGFLVIGPAASAEQAVVLTAAERPALAIMDIRLAGKRDGVDAALDLYRDHGIRCIFATAHNDQGVIDRAKPALALGWLRKPYTMTSLVDAVRQALDDLSAASQ